MKSSDNPYIGLRTYNEEMMDRFWGREDDINRLANSIINNSSTLIYGCSGCGKSSIIEAGVIPTLRNYKQYGKTFKYIPILLNPKSNLDFQEKNRKLRLWDAVRISIDNFLIKKESICGYWLLTGEKVNGGEMKTLSLWEKLNLVVYRDSNTNEDINFVIIIDQFEEVFQQNLNFKEIQVFFSTYELMCGYYKSDSIESIKDPSIVRLEAVKEYLYQIPENNHRLVVSIRQDFLYELEANASSYPVLYKNRIHISPLNEEQAFKVITSSKKNDGTPWFSELQAIEFIEDLTGRKDFRIDGHPEINVDPMMLSLYLQELCNNDKTDSDSAKNIIRDFYFKNMDIRGIEKLEAELLSSDGRYRKTIPIEDAEKIIHHSVLDDLDTLGILTKSMSNTAEWIGLRHDKLCEYAQMHIEVKEIQKKNIRNHSPLIYLTVHGRQMHENSYHIPDDLPQHLSFLHFIKGGALNAPDINLDFSGILQNSSSGHHCELRLSVMDKDDVSCYTEDGIKEISVKIVKGKIYDICFYGSNNQPCELYWGISGITFYYDQNGRVILKDYYRATSSGEKERATHKNGYTSILHIYSDNAECPSKTRYLNIDCNCSIRECGGDPKSEDFIERISEYKCRHRDGNYGYVSTYDNMGCEITRTFIDENEREYAIEPGYSQVKFERLSNDRIKSISYYKYQEKHNDNSVHERVYIYDDKYTKVNGEVSYDIDGHIIEHKSGFREVSYNQNGDIILVRNKGIHGLYELITLNEQQQLECILSYRKGEDDCITLAKTATEYRLYSPNGRLNAICELDCSRLGWLRVQKSLIYDSHTGGEICKEKLYDFDNRTLQVTRYDEGKKVVDITEIAGDLVEEAREIQEQMQNICNTRLQYVRLIFDNGFAPICINKKFGYINSDFELAIGCNFEDADRFVKTTLSDGTQLTYAKVKYQFENKAKWGTISPSGEFILYPTKYDKIFDYNPLNNGLIKVSYENLQAYVPIEHDVNDEEITIKYPFCHDFFIDKKLLIVGQKLTNKYLYGAVDRSGNIIINCEYDELNEYYTPYKTMILAGKGLGQDRKYGLFDISGKIILPLIYDEISPYNHDNSPRIKGMIKGEIKEISLD